jgi:hypothetical protein
MSGRIEGLPPELDRVIDRLHGRTMAAMGLPNEAPLDGIVAPEAEVSGVDAARRVLMHVLDGPMLEGVLEVYGQQAIGLHTLSHVQTCDSTTAMLLLSLADAFTIGWELRGELERQGSAPGLTPLEASGPGGPAFESFKSAVERIRPVHGGYCEPGGGDDD